MTKKHEELEYCGWCDEVLEGGDVGRGVCQHCIDEENRMAAEEEMDDSDLERIKIEREFDYPKFRGKYTSFILTNGIRQGSLQIFRKAKEMGFIYCNRFCENGVERKGWLSEIEMNEFVKEMQELNVEGTIEFNIAHNNRTTSLGVMHYCPHNCDRQEYLKFGVTNGEKWQHWQPVGGS